MVQFDKTVIGVYRWNYLNVSFKHVFANYMHVTNNRVYTYFLVGPTSSELEVDLQPT